MKVKVLLVALFMFAGIKGVGTIRLQAAAPVLAEAERAAILGSTVQIAMFEYAPEPGGAEAGSQGLGTLVRYGRDLVIITHDHWAHQNANLHEVEFRDAAGGHLTTLDAATFNSLVAYRDGGTMVLWAPPALQGLRPAMPCNAAARGETVWVARRAPATGRTMVEVVAATVTAVGNGSGPAAMRLRNWDSSVILPGDSGGGIWLNGRLAGNMWAAGVTETRSFWSRWLGSSSRPSDLAVAALQPLSGPASGLQRAGDLSAPGAQEQPGPSAEEDPLQAKLLSG